MPFAGSGGTPGTEYRTSGMAAAYRTRATNPASSRPTVTPTAMFRIVAPWRPIMVRLLSREQPGLGGPRADHLVGGVRVRPQVSDDQAADHERRQGEKPAHLSPPMRGRDCPHRPPNPPTRQPRPR